MPLWRAARNFQMPPKIIPNAATRSLIIYHSDLTGEVVPHTFISARYFLQNGTEQSCPGYLEGRPFSHLLLSLLNGGS